MGMPNGIMKQTIQYITNSTVNFTWLTEERGKLNKEKMEMIEGK